MQSRYQSFRHQVIYLDTTPMNQEMSTLFPNGIRALVVDDEARFLAAASLMLSIFDFKVSTCPSPTTALNLLTTDKIKDVDVVLANAAKVAACGFDFRGIVESDLCIPVVYFLPPDHKATGDEADELLRTLQAATCIIKKPLDAGQVCNLWKQIAWRKCCLDAMANQAGRNRVVPAAGGEAGSAMVEEREDEERVHFRVVNTGGGARKRKSGTNNAGSSSGTSLAGDDAAKKQKQKNVTEGQEMGNVGSQQQDASHERRSINTNKYTIPTPTPSCVYLAPPVYQAPAVAYDNMASSLIQSLNLGTDDDDELPVMVPMHTRSNEGVAMGMLSSGGYIDYNDVLAVARQQVGHGVAPEEAAGMEEATNSFSNHNSGSSLELDNDECFNNYSATSHMAPDHVFGMASNVVNELTMAGGAFGNNIAAPAMAVEDPIVVAPNGNTLAPGALDSIYDLLMEPQGPGAAMDGDATFDAEMFPDDQCEENIMFTLEELMGEDSEQDGATGGAAVVVDAEGISLIGEDGDEWAADDNLDDFFTPTTDAVGTLLIDWEGGDWTWDDFFDRTDSATAAAVAETSLVGGEGREGIWDFGAADNLDDFFVGDLWNFTPGE